MLMPKPTPRAAKTGLDFVYHEKRAAFLYTLAGPPAGIRLLPMLTPPSPWTGSTTTIAV